jgi:release factor glutamine methyltransferase
MIAGSGVPSPSVKSLAHLLKDAGIASIVLRCRKLTFGGRDVEVLIPPKASRAAIEAFEDLGWFYVVGGRGAWRLFPLMHYWWADGLNLGLFWRLTAAPFPSIAVRSLERALWEGASVSSDGYAVPDSAALLVHRACQTARPDARYHESDWEDFLTCLPEVTDWNRVWAVARAAGLTAAVRRALDASEQATKMPSGPVFDGSLRIPWSIATLPHRRMRQNAFTRFLAARPRLGELTARCRIRGTEVLSGPGVFVPTPDAELFVRLILGSLEGTFAPIVVEVGTGCGAIGLAIAHERADAFVHISDVSRDAIRWARRNRRRLDLKNVRVSYGMLLGAMAPSAKGQVTTMLANLPYYPAKEYVSVGAVPRATIEGTDDDGLGLIRMLLVEAIQWLRPGGRLYLQMFNWQWEKMQAELVSAGYKPGKPTTCCLGPFVIGHVDRVA